MTSIEPTEQHLNLPLTCIRPSPTNPRQIFDPAYIKELADSIGKVGVLQDLTVRRVDFDKGISHELVIGECRWRASKLAKLDRVPVKVVDWTDDQVMEAQLVENARRKDLHPLEESNTYARLLALPGWTEERVAERTSTPVAHVRERLRLQALTKGTRDLFAAGKFGVEIAVLLTRVPTKELQEKAAKEIAEGVKDEIRNADGEGNWEKFTRPCTVREAQAHLRREYMLRLAQAPFPTDDAELVPAAGACAKCPKRTGNQPELFADVKKPDVCTDPACFKQKTEANFKRAAAKAAEQKIEVLDTKEAKKIFADHTDHKTGNTRVKYDSKLVPLDAELPYDITKSHDSKRTWGSLVKGVEGAPKPVIVKDPTTGAVRELVDKTAVLAAAKKAGKLKPEKRKATSSDPNEARRKKEREKEKAEEGIRGAALERIMVELAEGKAPPAKAELAWWRWVAELALRSGPYAGINAVAARRGVTDAHPDYTYLLPFVEKAKTVNEVRGLLLELLFSDVADAGNALHDSVETKMLDAGLKLLGIDRKAHLEAAKRAAAAEGKVDKAKAGKKARRG